MLKQIVENINKHKNAIRELSLKIHSNPELGLQEKKACKWQIEFLKKNGFKIENPVNKMETAYKASFGKGAPVICIMSEYDALPEIGHACGHNLIAASALAAGVAVSGVLKKEKIPGTVVIMGTPAEEGLGGKVQLIKDGAFKGIDMVLATHPFTSTSTDPGWISVSGFRVKFLGKPAHAAGSPEEGINALDAVNLLFAGISAWRQQLPESTRVHGVIHKGGIVPNIIPDLTECEFYFRADNHKTHMGMEKRFKDIVKGAALMTGAKYEIMPSRSTYECSIFNKPLNDEFFDASTEIGMKPKYSDGRGRVSSDFGNVSRIIPSASYMFNVTKHKYPLHSIGFQKAAASDYAFEQTFNVAAAIAKVALKFYTDKGFRTAVAKDFKERK